MRNTLIASAFAAFLLHLVLGCCAHHADVSGSHESCSIHHEHVEHSGHSGHEESDESPAHPHGPCQSLSCVATKAVKADTELEVRQHVFVSSLDSVPERSHEAPIAASVCDVATREEPALRSHLIYCVLTI